MIVEYSLRTSMSRKVTVTVVLTEEEKERLRIIAEAEDRSLSYIAGKFVREGLARVEAGKSSTA